MIDQVRTVAVIPALVGAATMMFLFRWPDQRNLFLRC